MAVLGIITLGQEVAGAAEGTLAYTLAAIKDWTFWLGLGWVVGWGNGLIGVADPGGTLQGLATIPEGLWELSLGIYCTVKGFRPSAPILQPDAYAGPMRPRPAVTPA